MRHRDSARGSAGYTVLEVMVALFLFLAIGLICIESVVFASRVSVATVHVSQLDQRAHRVATRVVRELQEARMDSLVPDPVRPYGISTMTYRCAEIDDSYAIVWGNHRRLELVPAADDPADGTDNDGDGLTDEHDLRLVRDVGLPTEHTTVLTRDVAAMLEGELPNVQDDNDNGLLDEPGFSIASRHGVLEIRLSLQAVDPEGQITTRTAEMTVCPRN